MGDALVDYDDFIETWDEKHLEGLKAEGWERFPG